MRAPASRAWRGPMESRSGINTARGSCTSTLAYDYESRVTQITYPNQSTNSFSYNGLDTRVSKVDSTGTRTYLRDGAYVTDPVLTDGAATYTPWISERRSSATKFYHPDRLGTTERLTDTNQSTTDTRQYDAFGLLTSSSGSTSTPFGFAGAWGYQEDPDSGLKLLGHRYYDPSTGRFLTRDPVKDGRNWYGYCGNNPARYIDATGRKFIDPHPFWEGLRKFVNGIPTPVKSWGWAIDKFKKWIRGDEAGQTHTYGEGDLPFDELTKSRGGLSILDELPSSPSDGQIIDDGSVRSEEAFINTLLEPWNGVQAFTGGYTWVGRYDGRNREWIITIQNTTGPTSFFYHLWEIIGLKDHQTGPLGATKQEYVWTIR